MSTPRSLAALLGALLLVVSACGGSESSASSAPDADAPASTIGLGFEFEPGTVTGMADLRSIERPDDGVTSIVMIGDSITDASSEYLAEGFSSLGFDEALIEAQQDKRMAMGSSSNPSGAAIASYVSGADEDDEHRDELWIVALGTNDINQYGTLEEIGLQIDQVLDSIPEEATVLWVDTFYAGSDGGDGEVNLMIADRLDARGNAAIVPWSVYATGDGVMSGDGVHTSPLGREVFAGLVVGSVGELLDE